MPRHSHEHAEFACGMEGIHWSLLSNAGYTCRPGTLRFLPAGEPHENYFPNGARCLRIELRSPILDRAREYGAVLSLPGELATPAAALLSRLRVGRAQALLTSSELGLAEIALACGFSDQSHFTKAFRRITGMPPRLYRVKSGRKQNAN
jgi:AraC-like DNA-binding protein